jgi:hypothetical protein
VFPLILEDVRAGAEHGLEPLFRFLGVDPRFRPPSLQRRVYERRHPRGARRARMAARTAIFLRDAGLHRLLNRAQALGAARLVYRRRAPAPEPLSPETVGRLQAAFHGEAERLGRRLGRDLVKLWGLGA